MPINFEDLREHQKKCVAMVNSLGPNKIAKYIDRISELGRTYRNTAIGVFHIDDEFGRYLAHKAVPNDTTDWDKIRAENKIPLCFGLVDRQLLQDELNARDLTVAKVLEDTDEVAIVGVGFGAVIVFGVEPTKLDNRPGGN